MELQEVRSKAALLEATITTLVSNFYKETDLVITVQTLPITESTPITQQELVMGFDTKITAKLT